MLDRKWKIFYRELDENGNEIGGVGVYHKEYAYHGNALNAATKNYGPAFNNTKFCWWVAYRNPWATYIRTLYCDVCGEEYECEESYNHMLKTEYAIFIRHCHTDDVIRHVCPECTRDIMDLIEKKMGARRK